jgi:hypothetical protein
MAAVMGAGRAARTQLCPGSLRELGFDPEGEIEALCGPCDRYVPIVLLDGIARLAPHFVLPSRAPGALGEGLRP